MHSPISRLLLAVFPSLALASPTVNRLGHRDIKNSSSITPTAELAYGTYHGVHNEEYAQDFFLGMPYAQPPTGSLRFAAPQPLTTSFSEPRQATEYGNLCIGYGADTTNIGTAVSEDCLTINVVRPAGVKGGDDLPVAVWVHGGSYIMGGSRDPRYNLTWIVEQSVKEGKPIVAASINYRLSYWGFLFSEEMKEAGAGNIGFRDQRMALQWVQENIGAFGGSPDKVTIWGESAGARSLGMQLVAYEGQHDNLFRSAILESGSPVAQFKNASDWQPYFDAVVGMAGCGTAADPLTCLQGLPWEALNDIFNGTTALNVTAPTLSAVLDDDFMTAQGSQLLRQGKFAPVPLLLGNNFDEGTAYGKQGINTTAQFLAYLGSLGFDAALASAIAEVYPDDPSIGVPAFYEGRPAAYPYGLQFKRAAAFAGDFQQHAGRRLAAEMYAGAHIPVYSYLWNVHVAGVAAVFGATHFQEVAFVFDNTDGLGYSANPFEGKPETFEQLADLMSRQWVAFIDSTNPNLKRGCSVRKWPQYTVENPSNYVYDVNRTGLTYIAKDDYRKAEISYLLENVFS
ncbi:Alpha/Beta hydrolase protein [Xylariaceae sp. FL0016]|nr:Alpha/Beta hydrolase protein [Xylariaceae sp. FL0016]